MTDYNFCLNTVTCRLLDLFHAANQCTQKKNQHYTIYAMLLTNLPKCQNETFTVILYISARNAYFDIRGNTITELMHPHLVIYLDCPVSGVLEKIKARNDTDEANSKVYTTQYLKDFENAYKQSFLKDIRYFLLYNFIDLFDNKI